jgi:hypothetical protein
VLAVLVGFIVVVLVTAGILVMVGPRTLVRRIRSIAIPSGVPQVFEPRGPREAQPAVNPKTQRVLVASSRLAAWLRAHGHEEAARDIRTASARMTANEPAGLYALQTSLRRIRIVNVTESSSQERVQALVDELRAAVKDRFEQLELLPFRQP